ncbi:MAG TPA: helix-turn-helix domain-containing protein [Acidimicrobiales bacterium]|nr:helix-turn-helix domain-containing protein [Acidimicrobiales bacterium]
MNAVDLYILGRKLMQLAEGALPGDSWATSSRLLVADVAQHPDSSISEITARTGSPQSYVSTAVAKLRDLGVMETRVDPADHRRTLVRVTPVAIERAAALEAAPAGAVVRPALVGKGAGAEVEVVQALELLAKHLTPKASVRPPLRAAL